MRRPDSLPKGCEFYVFKVGIRPLWEDTQNKGGGRFVLHIKKQHANQIWEDILLALLATEDEHEKVNGIVINIRSWEILISIWMKELPTDEITDHYRTWIRLGLGISE